MLKNKGLSVIAMVILLFVITTGNIIFYKNYIAKEKPKISEQSKEPLTNESKNEESVITEDKTEESALLSPKPEEKFTLTSTKMGIIPNGYTLYGTLYYEKNYFVVLNPHGDNLFIFLKKGKNAYGVTMNGQEIGTYDYDYHSFEFTGLPIFSEDGKTSAYMARRGSKCFVVLNGKETGANDACDAIYYFILSRDGKRYAYTVSKRDAQGSHRERRLILDGKEVQGYFGTEFPVFSPDGKRFAFTGTKNEGIFLVVDGKEFGPSGMAYLFLPMVRFSPDSQHFIFTILPFDEETKTFLPGPYPEDDKIGLFVDGEKIGSYDFIEDADFSPDSKYLVYSVAIKEQFKDKVLFLYNVKEKKVTGPHARDYLEQFFSEYQEKSEYNRVEVKEEGSRKYVIIEGKEGKRYDTIDNLSFSPDKKRFAYIGFNYENKDGENESYVILDGKEIGPFRDVNALGFSPNGKHFVYGAQKEKGGKWFVVLDGKEKSYDEIYRPDTNEDMSLVYNNLGFDTESKYMYYGAKIGNEIWRIVDKIE